MKCVVVLKCFYKKDGHAFESTIVGSYKHIFVYVHVGNIYIIFQSICKLILDTIKLYFIQTRRQAHCINVSVN